MKNIIIVGGGSAGWMTAAYLATKTDHAVTVIESPNIPIVGVGESTIPSISTFLDEIGMPNAILYQA